MKKNIIFFFVFCTLFSCNFIHNYDYESFENHKRSVGFFENKIKKNPNIYKINFIKSSIEDKEIVRISLMRDFTELNLSQTKISDVALINGLSNLKSLKALSLAETKISDIGINAVLKNNKNIVSLDITGTDISDRILEGILQLNNLEQIALIGTDLTKDGIKKIKEKFPKCNIIEADFIDYTRKEK